MKKICIFIIFISIIFLQGNSGCQEKENPPSPKYVSGELIVKFKPGIIDDEGSIDSESIKALNKEYNLISMERVFKGKPAPELTTVYKLKFPAEIDIMKALQEYQKDPSVIYAEPNYIAHTMGEGNIY